MSHATVTRDEPVLSHGTEHELCNDETDTSPDVVRIVREAIGIDERLLQSYSGGTGSVQGL